MPTIARFQNLRLRTSSIDDRGLVVFPQEIVVEGGGNIPRPRPPIVGTDEKDVLFGTSGNDTVYGNGGADVIQMFGGNDTMYGGEGNDQYHVDQKGDVVIEYADQGTDSVYASIDYTLGDNVEYLFQTGKDDINGFGNDLDNRIIGNSGDNILGGGKGHDIINGGEGADFMMGGTGDDIFVVDNAGDIVWELNEQGHDRVDTSVSYTLSPNVEDLILSSVGGAIDGTGNGLDNMILGNEFDNVLKGEGGKDHLVGGGGKDKIYGGDGDDYMVVDGQEDQVIEYANGGDDTVFSTATYFLSNNVENLGLGGGNINGYGNDDGNRIWGGSGNNSLTGYGGDDEINGYGGKDLIDGGTGNDNLTGGAGADDTFRFHGDFGHDTIMDFSFAGDNDVIELAASQFADFNAVLASAQDVGSNVVITLDADHSITLNWVQVADLQASNFQFV
jgi:Ca2+-binding RTX toxin-like protein